MSAVAQRSFCIACGQETRHLWQRFDLRGRLPTFAIERCLRCGLGRTDPPPRDPYLAEALAGVAPISEDELRARVSATTVLSPWSREVARVLIERRVPQPVLDIGCGEGDLLSALGAAGFACRGLELRPSAVRLAQVGRGVTVAVGSIESFLAAPEQVGTIVLSHVLEHLPDPVGVLAAISPHAQVVAVAVPQSLSLRALVEWSRYDSAFAYAPQEHIWQMTRPALRGLLLQAHLRPTYFASRPLKAERRRLLDTACSALDGRRSPPERANGAEVNSEGPGRTAGSTFRRFARVAGMVSFQLFDRGLLELERRVSFLGDQIVALAEAASP